MVGGAAGGPPAPDRGDGERGGVVIDPDVDPAGVDGQVIDAVGDRLEGGFLGPGNDQFQVLTFGVKLVE
jgi:hypothetical protein